MLYIETERLKLRDWCVEDITAFRNMNADEEVMHYLPAILTHKQTDQFYETIQAEFAKCGYGLYAVECKEEGQFIGFIGFHRADFKADFTPCIEIGWRLKRSAWNQGYATEGARPCLDYGFDYLKFRDIYSFTAVHNKASIKVMEKIGMLYQRTFLHPKLAANNPLRQHVLYHVNHKSR